MANDALTAASPDLVPVAFLGRTSTLVMQDPAASLSRQLREVKAKLPAGWFVAAHYWDIESGGLDLDQRGHSATHQHVDPGIPRDGGLADLLTAAASPSPGFAAVVCEDIERSARDTFSALKLENKLAAAGVALFATDEHIDVAGANATTVLVRRIKQGVAEWFRLQIKEKAWQGLREHALDGWNTGTPPYGYLAQSVPHPNPAKASQGRTKTRLIPDPARAATVEQIFTWRARDKSGVTTIARRLNASPATYPPPGSGMWTPTGVSDLLANPKYTGHMVWNRTSKHTGRKRPLPPDQWIWTPAPVHPPIITRDLYDQAQAVTATRASITGDPAEPAHPRAQRTYELRSRIRHRTCGRRMHGTIRAAGVYYACPHDVTNPRHTATNPDHPRSVLAREDTLVTLVCQFISERILGPDRARLLAQQLPANAAGQAAKIQQQREALATQVQRLDAAQASQIRELDTLTADPADLAAHAMRARIREHFAELVAQRDQAQAQLTALDHDTNRAADPTLLDALPIMTVGLDKLPRHRAALYQALDIELLYSKQPRQVTIRATITGHTPAALAALINDSQPSTAGSHFPVPPIRGQILTADSGATRATAAACRSPRSG